MNVLTLLSGFSCDWNSKIIYFSKWYGNFSYRGHQIDHTADAYTTWGYLKEKRCRKYILYVADVSVRRMEFAVIKSEFTKFELFFDILFCDQAFCELSLEQFLVEMNFSDRVENSLSISNENLRNNFLMDLNEFVKCPISSFVVLLISRLISQFRNAIA